MPSHQFPRIFNHFLLKFISLSIFAVSQITKCVPTCYFSSYLRRKYHFLPFHLLKLPSSQIPNVILLILSDIHTFPTVSVSVRYTLKPPFPQFLHHSPVWFINYILVQGWAPTRGLHQMFTPQPHARYCLSLGVLERRLVFADELKWLQFKCLQEHVSATECYIGLKPNVLNGTVVAYKSVRLGSQSLVQGHRVEVSMVDAASLVQVRCCEFSTVTAGTCIRLQW